MNGSNTPWRLISHLLFSCLGLLVVGFVVVLAFGSVQGKQISPQTFELRSYEYYRIPWSTIQITPVQYTENPNDLVAFLADAGYLPSDANGSARWDEVSYQASGGRLQRGRAWVLASCLEMEDADRATWWLDWTEQHPEQARVLWRYVAQAARDRIYFVIPDLTVTAKTGQVRSLDSLQADLITHMKKAYSQQITALSLADESPDWIETLSAALEELNDNR